MKIEVDIDSDKKLSLERSLNLSKKSLTEVFEEFIDYFEKEVLIEDLENFKQANRIGNKIKYIS